MSEILIEGDPWDRVTPLYAAEGDKWIYDTEDLYCYIEVRLSEGVPISDLHIVLGEAVQTPIFDVRVMLEDCISDDHDWDRYPCQAINNLVNDWVAIHGPWSWEATTSVVDTASLEQWWSGAVQRV